MKISVCIPTYNGAKYITECLKSVCDQTITDFEIIVCDDGSTDNTVEIVKTFQQNDNRIKLFINEQNLGLTGNWSRSVELSSGEWIKFVFQDDIITGNCLERFLNVIQPDTQLVVCEREFIFEKDLDKSVIDVYNRVKRMYRLCPGDNVKYISAKTLSHLTLWNIPGNFIGEPSSIMFSRKGIESLGGFNNEVVQMMDLEFILRIGINYGFIYTPEKLVYFRVHNSSASQTNNVSKFFAATFSDWTALYYILLNDPRYVNFRKYNTGIDLLRIKILMYYNVYRARRFIRKNNDTPDLLSEFAQLDKHYKGIAKFANNKILFFPLDIYFAISWRIHKLFIFKKTNTETPKI